MSYYGNGMGGNTPYGQYGGFERYSPEEYERKRAADKSVRVDVFRTSAVVCCGVCAYVVLSNLYSRLIMHFPALYSLYTGPTVFGAFCDMLYSFVCVGLPFLLVLAVLNGISPGSVRVDFGKPYKMSNACLLIAAALGICFFGNVVGSILINFFASFGMEFYSYREAVSGTDIPNGFGEAAVMVIRTAVIPAIVEEFAFRGVVLGSLRKFGDGFAIAMSALLFGLLHGNFTQVPFAIIAGTALGFVYVLTGSIWASSTVHFLNNFISVCYSVMVAADRGSSAWLLSALITPSLIVLGVGALILYLLRNKNGLRLRPGKGSGVSGKALVFMLSPSFILGAAALIKNMLDDIVR